MITQDSTWNTTYLSMLQIERKEPSLGYLAEICARHLQTFPFENISKLLTPEHHGRIPSVDEFLIGAQNHGYGGTCFRLNTNLHRLLSHLGFKSSLVLLSGKHLALLVENPDLTQETLYVDCGSAAPIFTPIHFQSKPQSVACFASDCVSIVPEDADGRSYRYVRVTNGVKATNDWVFEVGRVCTQEEIDATVEKSMGHGTTFMSMLRCQLYQLSQERNLSLANNKFSIVSEDGTKQQYILHSIREIEAVLRSEFLLPHLPVADAIRELSACGVDIFTEEK